MSVQNVVEIGGDPTAVYRLFSADGTLLRVGITRHIPARFAQYQAEADWWPQVVRKTMTWYGSRDEAKAVEDAAILTEFPIHNVIGAAPEKDWPATRKRQPSKSRALENIPVKYPPGRIARDLERRIRSGEFTYGVTAPSDEELQAEYSVNAAVIRKALAILQRRGTIMTLPARTRPRKKAADRPGPRKTPATGRPQKVKPDSAAAVERQEQTPMTQAAKMFKEVTRTLPFPVHPYARHSTPHVREGVSLTLPHR